ncbi:hypothetical protein [Streptomyces sp. NPDC002530]
MTSSVLPPWLPEWEGAAEIAEKCDANALRELVGKLLDLVFAEDTVFLDSLPDALESALVSSLNPLSETYESDAAPVNLVVASRLVRRSVLPYTDGGPEELKALIETLPD